MTTWHPAEEFSQRAVGDQLFERADAGAACALLTVLHRQTGGVDCVVAVVQQVHVADQRGDDHGVDGRIVQHLAIVVKYLLGLGAQACSASRG